jgi:hypothetical protein
MKAWILVVLLALVVPHRARADGDTATEARARQVLIVLRVLAYDRALATRAPGNRVGVLILHDTSKTSRADAALWAAGFALVPNVKAGGRQIRPMPLEVGSEQALDAALALHRPALVILAGVSDIAVVRRATRKHQAMSFSPREVDVRAGVAFGIVQTEEGNQIVINLQAARAEGAKLGAGLLQLARLVEAPR